MDKTSGDRRLRGIFRTCVSPTMTGGNDVIDLESELMNHLFPELFIFLQSSFFFIYLC